jgi:hypothetical protein
MTDFSSFVLGFIVAVGLVAFPLNLAGTQYGKKTTMHEAFERGHAVQCLGRAGYYWECEP